MGRCLIKQIAAINSALSILAFFKDAREEDFVEPENDDFELLLLL